MYRPDDWENPNEEYHNAFEDVFTVQDAEYYCLVGTTGLPPVDDDFFLLASVSTQGRLATPGKPSRHSIASYLPPSQL